MGSTWYWFDQGSSIIEGDAVPELLPTDVVDSAVSLDNSTAFSIRAISASNLAFRLDNERVLSVRVQLFADRLMLLLLRAVVAGLFLGMELLLLVAALQTPGKMPVAAEAGPRLEVLAALAPLDEKAGGGVHPNGDVARRADVLVLVGDSHHSFQFLEVRHVRGAVAWLDRHTLCFEPKHDIYHLLIELLIICKQRCCTCTGRGWRSGHHNEVYLAMDSASFEEGAELDRVGLTRVHMSSFDVNSNDARTVGDRTVG
jgi:hypothetical protein